LDPSGYRVRVAVVAMCMCNSNRKWDLGIRTPAYVEGERPTLAAPLETGECVSR
jgi:hypothetical protein